MEAIVLSSHLFIYLVVLVLLGQVALLEDGREGRRKREQLTK